MGDLDLQSPAFEHNGHIPAIYTCDGKDISPPLTIKNVPSEAKSLALIVDDPDAPSGMWVHWVLWNISPSTTELGEGTVPDVAYQGTNDFSKMKYGGPCPPSGTHRYFFKLYALDIVPALSPGSRKKDLEVEMQGHILSETHIIGLYSRK